MLISLNWIKDFVDLPNSDADELANSFTMTTAEVEGVSKTREHLEQIKVAQIQSIRKHPEADKLNLVTFDCGTETKEVVCGAPNVREGLKVPYAPIGVTLPNGLTLEPKKIRGVLSEGMLCSETELGTGEGSSGLMELDGSASIGQSMLDYLDLTSDTILDVDNKSLTHRPDLWGHYGIAREFAARYSKTLRNPFSDEWQKKLEAKFGTDESPVTPTCEEGTSLLAYWGVSVDNVSPAPSPNWMQERLINAGLRPINNMVDISNYVMLEMGHPTHIFDRDKITDSKIIIKKITNQTNFTTLDEHDRVLIEGDTVISDSEKPLVLAGIMGGLNSGVSDSTNKIFIESANWRAQDVRQTSTRLGLRTDSSQRYEKALDSTQCFKVLLRTLELVLELCPQAIVRGRAEYCGEDLTQIKPLSLKITKQRIEATLGHQISDERLKEIFSGLEFEVEEEKDGLRLSVPTFRTTKDIEGVADIIEEVGRMIGYDNITPEAPMSEVLPTRPTALNESTRKIQDFLTLHAQSLEVMTYPLVGKKLLERAAWPSLNEELILVNALSNDADRMRPSLIPNALEVVAKNAKNFSRFSFFEIGRSYLSDAKSFAQERQQVLLAIFDKDKTPFLELINKTQGLLSYLNLPYDKVLDSPKFENEVVDRKWEGCHPHEFVNLRIMGRFKGATFSVHPLTLRQFKVKGHVSFAVIDITDAVKRWPKERSRYTSISKFPISTFDCTVIVDKKLPAASPLDALKKLRIKELTSRKVVDVYDLNEQQNAVTLRVTFEDPTKTLEAKLLKEAEEKVVTILESEGFLLKS